MHSAKSIDPDQPKHAAKANLGRRFSSPVYFLFYETLIYTSIPLRRNVSTRISLCGIRRVIWIDTLRSVHNVRFLLERLISIYVFAFILTHSHIQTTLQQMIF